MRRSQQLRRRNFHRKSQPIWTIDSLESRRMLSGETVVSPVPGVLANVANPAANSITLNQYFNDSLLPGTLATFQTTVGEIQVALTDAATPLTVANFLDYVNSGAYTDTIFHRAVNLNTEQGGTPESPSTIIQGGGYTISSGTLNHIPTNAPLQDEYTTELYGNVAGTIAMAKTSDANTADSEWYFNVTDNTELDNPTVDENGVTTAYTVFGTVVGGSSVIQQIANLPTDNLGSGLDTVPVGGLTEAQIAAGASVTASNLVFVTSVVSEPGTDYTVTSSNKALVTPKVTDGVLSFTYSPTLFGTAEITVKATNLDGTSTSTIVDVTVPNPATPGAGPVAADMTAPFTQTGTTGNFSIVADDTDSIAAFDPTSVKIVTGPVNGIAMVDTLTGHINYTPTAGYLGPDTLTYEIADTNGTYSNPATVTLDAVPGPATVSIGSVAKAKTLTYTDPSGIVAHVTMTTGTAVITFTDYRVNIKIANGVAVATGAGATITGISVTDKGTDATLRIASNGPVNIGSVQDLLHLTILAPNAIMTGVSSIGSSSLLNVSTLLNATLNFSTSPLGINLIIPNVTNSSITSETFISTIKSKQWLNTDGGNYVINAPFIGDLEVPGEFDEQLSLSSTGYSLYKSNVTTPTAPWKMAGSMHTSMIGTPGPGWSLTADGLVNTLTVKGNLGANSIQVAVLGTMTVTGTSTGATIQTDGTFGKKFTQIGKITFKGAASNTVVFAAGNIGTVSALSLTNCRIYAGVNIGIAQNGALAGVLTDFSDAARIGTVSVGKGANSFSNVLITAEIIGSLKLGNIATANNGHVEGISAHTISSISGTLVPGGIFKAGAAQLKTAATLTAYETLKKLTLGDFQINLI